jgi:hypothetical protein
LALASFLVLAGAYFVARGVRREVDVRRPVGAAAGLAAAQRSTSV